eukprot:Platyproteum_vivax@DN3013_c0_g1_i2.p2
MHAVKRALKVQAHTARLVSVRFFASGHKLRVKAFHRYRENTVHFMSPLKAEKERQEKERKQAAAEMHAQTDEEETERQLPEEAANEEWINIMTGNFANEFDAQDPNRIDVDFNENHLADLDNTRNQLAGLTAEELFKSLEFKPPPIKHKQYWGRKAHLGQENRDANEPPDPSEDLNEATRNRSTLSKVQLLALESAAEDAHAQLSAWRNMQLNIPEVQDQRDPADPQYHNFPVLQRKPVKKDRTKDSQGQVAWCRQKIREENLKQLQKKKKELEEQNELQLKTDNANRATGVALEAIQALVDKEVYKKEAANAGVLDEVYSKNEKKVPVGEEGEYPSRNIDGSRPLKRDFKDGSGLEETLEEPQTPKILPVWETNLEDAPSYDDRGRRRHPF